MHAGSIKGDTKAARVYKYLQSTGGGWLAGPHIAFACSTDCVSTRISEVRRQLPPGEAVESECRQEPGIRENGKPGMVARWFYRIVKA